MAICADCNGSGKKGRRDCNGCGGGGDSDRWETCIHEAAHVEAARVFGATKIRARILGRPTFWRNWAGWTEYHFDGDARDEALIILAGGAAAGSSPDDLRTARKLLRRSGLSLKQAQREAAEFVSAHQEEIGRTARRLQKRGRT